MASAPVGNEPGLLQNGISDPQTSGNDAEVLPRVTDVLLTLVPLLLAGAVTLGISVLDGLALNFANIIALPLLLGVGVAFKIYYIMAWRAGKTGLLQSTLTRAVVFSAMANAIAFGSMWPRTIQACQAWAS